MNWKRTIGNGQLADANDLRTFTGLVHLILPFARLASIFRLVSRLICMQIKYFQNTGRSARTENPVTCWDSLGRAAALFAQCYKRPPSFNTGATLSGIDFFVADVDTQSFSKEGVPMKTARLFFLLLASLLLLAGAAQSADYPAVTPLVQGKSLAADASLVPANSLLFQPEKWSSLSPGQQHAIRLELRNVLMRGGEEAIARLPVFITLSDTHGTIDKYDALLLDALRSVPAGSRLLSLESFDADRPLAEQLAVLGIRLADFRGQIFFHNLGDLIDRGARGVAVYQRTREMIDAGLMDFVIGNHDFWMFMNLQGFHLPFYKGYRFYGYGDSFDARYGRVEDVVSKNLEVPEIRTAEWWEQKLAEFTLRKEKEQKQWAAGNGVQARVNALFKELTAGKSVNDIKRWGWTKEGRLWNSLRGHDVKVGDVYIGVRGVGMVSLRWWQDLLAEFKVGLDAVRSNEQSFGLWQQAIDLMENDIIPVLHKDLEDRLAKGEWWVRVFEAINFKNYESAEWWAKDWAFHKDWGTAIFSEISPAFREDKLEGKVSFANYLKQPRLQEISTFYRQNFTLFQQDVFGNTLVHGFLPVDEKTGEFFFVYKGKEYRGGGGRNRSSVWQGLRRIESDVRNTSHSLNELQEALTLVNGWYADRTTIAKAADVANAVNQIGSEKLAQANGISRLFMGHVPFEEFITRLTPEQRGSHINGFLIDDRIVLTDHGMGKRYGSRGAYVRTSARDGLSLNGFEHGKSKAMSVSPRTLRLGDNGNEQLISTNVGLHPLVFRNYLLEVTLPGR